MSIAPVDPAETLAADAVDTVMPASRGFWGEAWRRYRRRPLAMVALAYVVFLTLVASFAPAIAGTKPIVAYYKHSYYFPALGYVNREWENSIFHTDRFRMIYPKNLEKKDPESWAIWPLVYQDPYRRIREGEWPGQPENPSRAEGRPSRNNWFGTTQAGIDVFAQMVHGTRVALLVGFVSMGIASAIGIVLGALAGYLGGWVDMLISRFIELVMCVPTLVLILALIAVLEKPTIWHIMAVIGVTGWTGIARLTRAEFIKLRQIDFVTAAEAIGVQARIMFRYILPNALAPILVPITFGIASAILTESALSFLGVGAPPPNPSWGKLLDLARGNPLQMWWLVIFPGAAIFLAVLAYNLIGEGLQEATDPRLREGR